VRVESARGNDQGYCEGTHGEREDDVVRRVQDQDDSEEHAGEEAGENFTG